MHDGGADGVIHETDASPTTYIQSSVTSDPVTKINGTLARLKEYGRDCRELIFCSPHEIQITTETLKTSLRKKGVSLDVRDRKYFTAFCDVDTNRANASAAIFKQIAAPILVTDKLIGSQETQLTTRQEKLAFVYLTVAVANSDPNKSITSVSYESLLTYAFRDTNSANTLTKEAIIQRCRDMVPAETGAIFQQRAEGAFATLENKGIVKYHSEKGGYHLAHAEQQKIEQSIMALELEVVASLTELRELTLKLEKQLKIAAPLPVDLSARIILASLNQVLAEQGDTVATALTKRVFCAPSRDSIKEIISQHIHILGEEVKKHDPDSTLDFYAIIVEVIIRQPPKAIAEYLKKVADAYFLFFTLKQPPEVQDAVSKIVSKSRIVVDASMIVPALAEYAFATEERLNQHVLKAAVAGGAELIVTNLALNEVVTQLGKARAIYERVITNQPYYGQSALVTAYFQAKGAVYDNFYKFLALFTDSDNPNDIGHLLFREFGFSVNEVALQPSDHADYQNLFQVWSSLKKKRPSTDEAEFSMLIDHDVRTFQMIKNRRRGENVTNDQYGHTWWWLTHDSTAHSIDRSSTTSKEVTICMRPDYLLRYVSASPGLHRKAKDWSWNVLPLSIDLAGCGLVPEEIIKANALTAGIAEGDPDFLRQRKLRNLINQSKAL